MKVNIGKFTSDLIPVRRWERSYEFWREPNTCYLKEEQYTWYDKIVFGFFDKLSDLVLPINRWSNNRKRKIKIHIDGYDVWDAGHTLAMIITPTLKKLKEIQHGYPHVENEDVPEELRFEMTDDQKANWDGSVDDKHEARWNYILGEMIWAFEQEAMDDDTWQFHHNSDQLEILFVSTGDADLDSKGMKSVDFNYQKDPTKPKYWVDREGKKKHEERKANGLRLFAKYYQCLWD